MPPHFKKVLLSYLPLFFFFNVAAKNHLHAFKPLMKRIHAETQDGAREPPRTELQQPYNGNWMKKILLDKLIFELRKIMF